MIRGEVNEQQQLNYDSYGRMGATVIVTERSASKARIVEGWGLDHGLSSDKPDLAARIKTANDRLIAGR